MSDYKRVNFDDKPYYFIGNTKTWFGKTLPTPNNVLAKVASTGFDENLFKSFITNRDYDTAAKYGRMFHMKDPFDDVTHRAEMRELERKGRYYNAIYNNATSKNDLQAIDFSMKVFEDGGLENIDDIDNPFSNAFKSMKESLGSSPNGKDKADRISITFDTEKKKLFGIDWLAKDNQNTLQNFMDRMGYNVDYLRSNGVEVVDTGKAGQGTITIDKSNPLFNKLIYDMVLHRKEYGGEGFEIKGFKDGKQITEKNFTQPGTVDYNTEGDNDYVITMGNMYDLINRASGRRQEIEENSVDRTYSGMIYGYASPEVGELVEQSLTQSGTELSATLQHIKTLQEGYHAELMGTPLSQYNVFSNINDTGVEMLDQIDDIDDKEELKKAISEAFEDGRAIYQFMEFDGRFGTLVTLPATTKKTWFNSEGGAKAGKSDEIQVFIEDLFTEEAKKRAYNDASYLAVQDIDDIRKYNYQYRAFDDTEIGVERRGMQPNLAGSRNEQWYRLTKGGKKEYITADEALRIVEQDRSLEQGYNGLINKYINEDGEVTDKKALDEDIKAFTAVMINTTYQNGDLISPDDFLTIDRKKVNKATADKLSEAMKVYYELLYRFSHLQDL